MSENGGVRVRPSVWSAVWLRLALWVACMAVAAGLILLARWDPWVAAFTFGAGTVLALGFKAAR